MCTEEKENWSRKYSSVEKVLRKNKGVDTDYELKATQITNGRYELQEALEQEFKLGTCNYRYDTYYPPIFNKMKDVQLEM